MSNKKAVVTLQKMKSYITTQEELDHINIAIKALEKDKCSTCEHYDKDYGETCLNPSGSCRVFEYDRYEEKEE